MSPATLTPRQQQILRFIQQHLEQHQRPPTQVEIAAAMGFRSRTAAKDHLKALERKGYLHLDAEHSRGIRLLEREQGLPLIGRVAAGAPLLAVENIESWQACDPNLFSPRADYLLRVQGWSMRDAGIADADLLAVHKSPEAQHGQIVVARLDDEVTVKRLWRQADQIRLLPENPEFSAISIDPARQAFSIEGLMVGLIRQGVPV